MSTPIESLQEPVTHKRTERKKRDWNLVLKEKNRHLIIGDNNLEISDQSITATVQIDCYPGATLRNILNVLEKNEVCPDVETVILSLGIYNRKQQLLTATKEAQRLYKLTITKFPKATIYFPTINFSAKLPESEQEVLKKLNEFLTSKYRIPPLTEEKFETQNGDIQWTNKTTTAMLDHWVECLNY